MMSASNLPSRAIQASLETQEFWAATAVGRFLLRHCNACGTAIWYPRSHCPICMSTDVSWVDAAGTGVVYSFSITRVGGGQWKGSVPYVLAYVELDEGPRVLTNIVGCPVDDVRMGMAVRVVFEDVMDGSALYRFAPLASGDA